MDNIIEWLFFILFIIATLSSALKKNKPESRKTEGRPPARFPQPENRGSIDPETDDRQMDDPFADLEKILRSQLPGGRTEAKEIPEAASGNRNYDYRSTTLSGSDYFSREKKQFENRLPESYTAKAPYSGKAVTSDKQAEKDRSKDLLIQQALPKLNTPLKKENKRAAEIKGALKDRDSFRNLFIMSEILGKPKALRR